MERTHEREDQSDLNATPQAVIRKEPPYLKGRFGGYLLDSGVRVGDEGEEEGRKTEEEWGEVRSYLYEILLRNNDIRTSLLPPPVLRLGRCISEGGKRPWQGEQILNL